MADPWKRREVIGDATLYLGDCLEILPTLPKVDAVITSPPYNTLDPKQKPSGIQAERKSGKNLFLEKQGGYFDQRDEDEYQKWQQQFLVESLKIAPVVWINHKTRYRNGIGIHPLHFYKGPLFAEVVWDRCGSIALNCGRFAPSHEYWFGFGSPSQWDNSVNKYLSVWRIQPTGNNGGGGDHPCPYPLSLVTPIVKACVFESGAVDPFMGSGTTGVACMNLGRKFVGIEMEEKYFDFACDRIRNAQRQARMFA